jgi:hypothetical protein
VEDEDTIEACRATLRAHPADPEPRDEITWLLTWAAEGSWLLLESAWDAYERLPLPPLPGIAQLERDSLKELSRLLGGVPQFDSHLGRSVAELGKREVWRARLEDLNTRGDPIWREVLRREGRVISATIMRARAGRLLLRTGQGPRRVRVGTWLQDDHGRVEGVVVAIRPDEQGAWISVQVTRGKATTLPLEDPVDWTDTVLFRGRPPRIQGAGLFTRMSPAALAAPLPSPAEPGLPPARNWP